MNETIVLGITSSIAAFKILDLIKQLKKEKINVVVIMTASATKMLNLKKLQEISGNKVYIELFEKNFDYKKILKEKKVDHIEIAKQADIFVIAPATAHTIAKIAQGFADDFLTTSVLATTAPILICPSMNTNMWSNFATKENVEKLKKRGLHILKPSIGKLACGVSGVGKLPEIEKIKKEILSILKKRKLLKGKKVIVTAGGTMEPIDSVRVITNRASGKMGVAIADACFVRGAEVVFLKARSAVDSLNPYTTEIFETSDELYALIKKHAKNANSIFHTAAVSDFTPKDHVRGKLSSKNEYNLRLVPQRKIINEIKQMNSKIAVIAFKAVYKLSEKEMINKAREKLAKTPIDAVVVNDIGKKDRGFMVDTNEVIVVQKEKQPVKIPLSTKREVAERMIGILF